jgi:hypothetical protein
LSQNNFNPRPEDAAARLAFRELKRLANEASRFFGQNSLVATTSSLAAMSTVLDPLLGYLQHSWIADAAETQDDESETAPPELYL